MTSIRDILIVHGEFGKIIGVVGIRSCYVKEYFL